MPSAEVGGDVRRNRALNCWPCVRYERDLKLDLLAAQQICCRIFTPAQPGYPAASVRDYCSGV